LTPPIITAIDIISAYNVEVIKVSDVRNPLDNPADLLVMVAYDETSDRLVVKETTLTRSTASTSTQTFPESVVATLGVYFFYRSANYSIVSNTQYVAVP
jgi:hypothetical protein